MQEETGTRAGHIRHLAHFYTSYAHSSQGSDHCLATELIPDPPEREITEQDMVHRWFSDDDFRRMIEGGEIVDAATLAAYTYVILKKQA